MVPEKLFVGPETIFFTVVFSVLNLKRDDQMVTLLRENVVLL